MVDNSVRIEPSQRETKAYALKGKTGEDKIINLQQEHPDFTAIKNDYYRCRVFAQGGAAIEGKEEFLKKHVYESKAQYAIRLWLSKYRNHAQPIIDVFHAAVWETEPDRQKLDSVFQPYLENIDHNNTSTNDFFRKLSRNVAESGIAFVLVDHISAPKDIKLNTKKEADSYKMRPFFKQVNAENLIDWGFEKDKSTGIETLAYIVFKEITEISSIPFKRHTFQEQYNLWTKTGYEIWAEQDGKARIISSGAHQCGIVPIVPCCFMWAKPMTGKSAIIDIVGLCEKIYRNGSCLEKSLYDTAFPLQLFLGFESSDLERFRRSSSSGLASPNIDADSRFIEPEGRSFDALRQAIESDEKTIKELALRMLRPDNRTAESAESRKLDQKQLNSKLSNFAINIEQCEEQCWKIFGLWLGMQNPQVDVEYSKAFDDTALSVEIINIFKELASENVIPWDEVIDALMRSGFLPDTYDKEEAKQRLKDQARIDPNYPGQIKTQKETSIQEM